jgi:hypothetical protein
MRSSGGLNGWVTRSTDMAPVQAANLMTPSENACILMHGHVNLLTVLLRYEGDGLRIV